MADTKISGLTALTGSSADFDADLVPVVDTSATTTKKMTLREFATAIGLPPGLIMPYAGSSAPTGWLLCYGQAVSRTDYADLFTAISTTYGAGDGSTTFNLPDLRGRVVAGKDDMGGTSANRLTNQTGGLNGDTLGATGGAETHTLTSAQVPATAVTFTGSAAGDGQSGFGEIIMFDSAVTGSVTGASTGTVQGGGGAHNNVQPTIIANYIIKI